MSSTKTQPKAIMYAFAAMLLFANTAAAQMSTKAIPPQAQDQQYIELPVSAHMDIYRAGGYDDGSDGIAPVVYSFPARPLRTLTFSSVAGEWTCSTSVPKFGADGSTTADCPTIDIATVGTFAGYDSVDFLGGMVGMFLEDGLPPAAPPQLKFYVNNDSQGGIQTDFRTLSPKIGQVFFIGDGLTGTGTGKIQVFQVPSTATHLYLGYIDACNGGPVPSCYSDNAGSLLAVFRIENHTPDWVEPTLSSAPSARIATAMTYDAATHSTVLFGGNSAFSPGQTYGDTWIWRDGWTQLFPAASPPARGDAGIAYDPTMGKAVLFGGIADTSNALPFGDTWTWDGVTWDQLSPPISPPPRSPSTFGMVYDPVTDTVVLFGGIGMPTGAMAGYRSETPGYGMAGRKPGPRNFRHRARPRGKQRWLMTRSTKPSYYLAAITEAAIAAGSITTTRGLGTASTGRSNFRRPARRHAPGKPWHMMPSLAGLWYSVGPPGLRTLSTTPGIGMEKPGTN